MEDQLDLQKRGPMQRVTVVPVIALKGRDECFGIGVGFEAMSSPDSGVSEMILQHRNKQIILVDEVRVERSAREARFGGDLVDRRCADAAPFDDPCRGLEDPGSGLFPRGANPLNWS